MSYLSGMGDISTGAVAAVMTPLLYSATKGVNDFLNFVVYSGYPSPPAPAPPPAVVNPSQSDLGQSAIDASLQAGAAANQQTYQQFFGTVADTNSAANAGLGFWFWAALGLGALALIDLTKVR